MKLQDLQGKPGFIVLDGGFRRVCDCIAELPGVQFTDRRWFFWGSGDERAEFEFRGYAFAISCDWEGDYWITPKDENTNPAEIRAIREHVAQFTPRRRAWIDRLKDCFGCSTRDA